LKPAFLAPHTLTGIAAPLTVWALHFVLVYAMQGLACAQDWQRTLLAGREAVFWWLLLATLAAAVAIACLGLRAWRSWRAQRGALEDVARRRRFAARLTLASAAMALLAVAFTATPIFLLPTCG
jgi:hypothetical protein